MREIRVLSRDSALAVRQAEIVIDAVKRAEPTCSVKLLTMKTEGDRILDRTLDEVGGKGLFVKELDAALLRSDGDISVHSYKDMPCEDTPELPIAAVSERGDPRDALVLPLGATELDFSKPIGCSSVRRAIQLKAIFPNAAVAPVRGNVPTRLHKLDGGEYSSLILAIAGLTRLGLRERVSRVFSVDEIIPAAGQAIIAVQARKGENTDFLRFFHNENAKICSDVERAFISALGADCFAPVAAYATLESGNVTLKAMYAANGTPRFGGFTVDVSGAVGAARELAGRLMSE